MNILVLNSGSSSQKACVYQIGESLPETPPPALWKADVEWDGNKARVRVASPAGTPPKEDQLIVGSRREAVERLLKDLWSGTAADIPPKAIDVVGHRVVHGGPDYYEPARITPEVKQAIERVGKFAPLHYRAELEGMELVEKLLGTVPQVAVFDTGFHHAMPPEAAVYPLPYEWYERGIRRYGFHGINHQYCAERAPRMLDRDPRSLKIVNCHLGNGCSVAAIANGQSLDTTMGFTPLEGLMMGTRSGSIDPGILTYLMREHHLTGDQLDDLLNRKSGLLGISGFSGDMRAVIARKNSGDQRAALAFAMFVLRLQAAIGAMAAVLGGMGALVFTAGIGEHSAEVREATCANLAHLSVVVDREKNRAAVPDAWISSPSSQVAVLVIAAQEDWMIARACYRLSNAPNVSQA